MRSHFFLVTILMLGALTGAGQVIDKAKTADKTGQVMLFDSPDWYEGSLVLNDDTELKGLIKYNSRTGVVSYQRGDDTRSFTARNIRGFEFFDDKLNKQRVFYIFPYEESKTDIVKPLIFELIKDFADFIVISKIDPPKVESKTHNYQTVNPQGVLLPGYLTNTTEISVVETICFMNADGKIEPYVKITDKEIEGVLFDRTKTKNKFVDKELLMKYTGSYYDKLVAYAKEHDLSFNRKLDLLKVLDYYKQIVSN